MPFKMPDTPTNTRPDIEAQALRRMIEKKRFSLEQIIELVTITPAVVSEISNTFGPDIARATIDFRCEVLKLLLRGEL